MKADTAPPLVVHVIYALGTGGLENGLVNLINRTPATTYRHAIVCLTEADDFSKRITVTDVPVVALHKRPGHDLGVYWRFWKALRALRPSIVHTRNLAALEMQPVAALAGSVKRVHGEHGRDIYDLHGDNPKYNVLRRFMRLFVHRYTAVSQDLERWLADTVRVSRGRIRQIYNGVDIDRFTPKGSPRIDIAPSGFLPANAIVIGTVGRMAVVKDQASLVEAFGRLRGKDRQMSSRLRLVIAGDGPEREALQAQAASLGLTDSVWFPGDREDVPDLLRLMDLFVLPSLAEGISNTILEAMATGLPVVATNVGGNPELIDEGVNGFLVSPGDPESLAAAILRLLDNEGLAAEMGTRGLAKAREFFDWDRAVDDYLSLYDELLGHSGH